MNYIAEITIMPHKALLDPQGKAVAASMSKIGLAQISQVRIGKHIQLELEAANAEEAKQIAEDACKKLLANTITEYFEIQVQEATTA